MTESGKSPLGRPNLGRISYTVGSGVGGSAERIGDEDLTAI